MALRGICDSTGMASSRWERSLVEGLGGMLFVRESGTDAKVCRGAAGQEGQGGPWVTPSQGKGWYIREGSRLRRAQCLGPVEEFPRREHRA